MHAISVRIAVIAGPADEAPKSRSLAAAQMVRKAARADDKIWAASPVTASVLAGERHLRDPYDVRTRS